MKKYKFNKSGKSIIIQSSLMAGIMLITGCSQLENTQITVESSSDISITSETIATEPISAEITSTPTPTPIVYAFSWSADDSRNFATYFEQTTGYPNMRGYIQYFGFTDDLNKVLTNYVNDKYSSNYESIPFSKVSYFHTYMVDKEVGYRTVREDYDSFYSLFLNSNKIALSGSLVNKLIMSYFYQNQIPLGTRIPYENLMSLEIDDINTFSGVGYILDNGYMQLGNYDSSYEYSNYELFAILEGYNSQVYRLCNDERIKNLDLLTNDPEFPQAAEAREIYNGFLRDYYGFDNCPQFGEVVTREQYIQIFGEEPLDLSYIPGAVVKDAAVKGSARAMYNDNINNYDVAYMPGYEYYTEETESTRSR